MNYTSQSTFASYLLGYVASALAWIVIGSLLLQWIASPPAAPRAWPFVILGAIATWRYAWVSTHFVRSLWYRWVAFPNLRARSRFGKATHIYVVVLSYKMEPRINAMVYTALINAIEQSGSPGTIVACISEDHDIDLLKTLRCPETVNVIIMKQTGAGKRDAMERALKSLIDGTQDNAYLALIDGDSVVPSNIFQRTVPLLANNPQVGALTCNNAPAVRGNDLIRQWYWLRMQHRHILMCSLSLSHKVLVLTGRFSLFRADVALAPDFIRAVGHDAIDHWRLGRIIMLTGDDKSTWFNVLYHGWGMLYVPDVSVVCLEKALSNNLLTSTVPLMTRYYGNMARNNGRAVRLGPIRTGLFLWWSLIDQRLSAFTTILGPTTALIASLLWWRALIILYLGWAFSTRTLQGLLIGTMCGRFHPYMNFLLLYNQIVGAVIKIAAFVLLDKQKWTRQKTGNLKAKKERTSAVLLIQTAVVVVLLVTMFVAVER